MCRSLIFTISLLFCITLPAQEIIPQKIETQVEKVTVFLKGAQITRTHEAKLEKGVYNLQFTGLSPYIDANSIRMNAKGELTVLNVEHKLNYLKEDQLKVERPQLKKEIQEINDSLNILTVKNDVIASQLDFLHHNRKMGESGGSQVANLKEAARFYKEQLTSLKMQQLEISNEKNRLTQEKGRLQKQLGQSMNVTEPTSSEIYVNVEVKTSGTAKFELDYLVGASGWYPTYDIRVESIDQPIQWAYKANVHQNTAVDWEDVQLTFSTAQPSTRRLAPELRPYYIDLFVHRTHHRNFDQLQGRVIDAETGEPLIFASVNVAGTSIGTQTDQDGNFALLLPEGKDQLHVSYVGYRSKVVPITSPHMTIELESGVVLDEIVTVEYQVPLVQGINQLAGASAGSGKGRQASEDIPLPLQSAEQLMNLEFSIEQPYTIPNGTNKRTLEIQRRNIPALFHYYAVPKLDRNAYLMAEIVDWQDYHLIPGEAQLYFENTYIGSSLIDPAAAEDTLSFSLGADKNIAVERELIRDFSKRHFFNTRTEVTKAYRFTVQNNKSDTISIIIADQIPISKNEKIQVEVLETSGVSPHPETGRVEWNLELAPKESAERQLHYEVSVPRGREAIVE